MHYMSCINLFVMWNEPRNCLILPKIFSPISIRSCTALHICTRINKLANCLWTNVRLIKINSVKLVLVNVRFMCKAFIDWHQSRCTSDSEWLAVICFILLRLVYRYDLLHLQRLRLFRLMQTDYAINRQITVVKMTTTNKKLWTHCTVVISCDTVMFFTCLRPVITRLMIRKVC